MPHNVPKGTKPLSRPLWLLLNTKSFLPGSPAMAMASCLPTPQASVGRGVLSILRQGQAPPRPGRRVCGTRLPGSRPPPRPRHPGRGWLAGGTHLRGLLPPERHLGGLIGIQRRFQTGYSRSRLVQQRLHDLNPFDLFHYFRFWGHPLRTGGGTRTHTPWHKILSLACLPIPTHPQNFRKAVTCARHRTQPWEAVTL